MNSPEYEELNDAIDTVIKNLASALSKAFHQAVETAYLIGARNAAQSIAKMVLGRTDEPNEEGVIEMCRRLWEDDGK